MRMTKLERKHVEYNHSRFEQLNRRHGGVEHIDDIDAVADDSLDGGRRDLVHDQVPVLVGEFVGCVRCCQQRVVKFSYTCIYIKTNWYSVL